MIKLVVLPLNMSYGSSPLDKTILLFSTVWGSYSSENCMTLLTNGKILDRSKVKAFTGDKIDVSQKKGGNFVLGRRENEEILVSSIFSFFPHCLQKASFSGSLKVGIVWLGLNNCPSFTPVYSFVTIFQIVLHCRVVTKNKLV